MKTGKSDNEKTGRRVLWVLAPLGVVLLLAATIVTPGKRISEYPRVTTLADDDMLVAGRTNTAVPTNVGITAVNFFLQGSNGLASTNFVNTIGATVSNGVILVVTNTSNFLAASALTRGSNMLNLQYLPEQGATYYAGTNGTPATNGRRAGLEFSPFWRSLRMGEVEGGTDIYGIIDRGSNYWDNTNIGPLTVGLGSNAYVKAAFSSVLGGRNNAIRTNAENSVIGGGIDNLIDTNAVNSVIAGGGRNSIRSTNTGSPATLPIAHVTIGGGSNNNVLGLSKWSTIGGGGDNTMIAVQEATIAGGFGNTIQPDGRNGFIGGGNNNNLGVSGGTPSASISSVLGGGSQNNVRGTYSFLGGGFQNKMYTGDDYCTIGGGQLNAIGVTPSSFSTHATIGGGSGGLIEYNAHWSVISGGLRNQVLNGSTNGTVCGGEDNVVQANAPFGTILGGRDNTVTSTGDYSTIAGVSNEVSASYAMALGLLVTNRTANSVMASEFISYNTPAVIAGAGSGSTNYTLQLTSPEMVLGSSNVNIVAAMGWIDGKTHKWDVSITNLSANTWGFSFSAVSNRVKWQSWMYGTNAPVVLTNDTLLRIHGTSTGSNTLCTYEYFNPGL